MTFAGWFAFGAAAGAGFAFGLLTVTVDFPSFEEDFTAAFGALFTPAGLETVDFVTAGFSSAGTGLLMVTVDLSSVRVSFVEAEATTVSCFSSGAGAGFPVTLEIT